MGEGDLQDDVRELRKQVEALREVLGEVAEPYREIAGYFDQLQTITRGYFRLLDLYAKHGAVSPNTRTSLCRAKETRGDIDVGRQGKGAPTAAGEREGDLRHFFGEDARLAEQPHGFDLRKGCIREVRAGGREFLHDAQEERDVG